MFSTHLSFLDFYFLSILLTNNCLLKNFEYFNKFIDYLFYRIFNSFIFEKSNKIIFYNNNGNVDGLWIGEIENNNFVKVCDCMKG